MYGVFEVYNNSSPTGLLSYANPMHLGQRHRDVSGMCLLSGAPLTAGGSFISAEVADAHNPFFYVEADTNRARSVPRYQVIKIFRTVSGSVVPSYPIK